MMFENVSSERVLDRYLKTCHMREYRNDINKRSDGEKGDKKWKK